MQPYAMKQERCFRKPVLSVGKGYVGFDKPFIVANAGVACLQCFCNCCDLFLCRVCHCYAHKKTLDQNLSFLKLPKPVGARQDKFAGSATSSIIFSADGCSVEDIVAAIAVTAVQTSTLDQ